MRNFAGIVKEYSIWLGRTSKPNGKSYAKSSIDMYCRSVKKIFDKSPDVRTVEELSAILDEIEKYENSVGTHKTDFNALKHYIRFYKESYIV